MAEDYYAALGVSRSATADDIKKAYLRLARELHPDANQGDAATEEQFKAVTQAYETLRDPERRRQYDMFGAEGPRGSGGGDPFGGGAGAGGLGDLFDAFFGGAGGSPFGGGGGGARRGGPPAGEDAETVIDLEFAEAVFGAERELTTRALQRCATCEGSGARPGTTAITCTTCKGAGEVRRVRQSILGQMVTAGPCPTCGGTGQEIPSRCQDCAGQGRRREERTFVVEVPAGVDTGSTLRLPGRGSVGPRGGPAGDLFVHVRTKAHPTIARDGTDLRTDLHVALTQAVLGAQLPLETLDGTEEVHVDHGTPSGKEIRLRGRGVPHLQGRGRGDLIARVVVDMPTDLSKSQEELVRRLAAERGEVVAEHDGIRSKLRSAFK